MIIVHKTEIFEDWLARLRDRLAKASILRRVDRIANGNFGRLRSLGDGVAELKIDVGPGYRIYYVTNGPFVVLLLCGGDKGSQDKDIARAKQIALDVNWEELK